MKTHKATAKRFRKTSRGKIVQMKGHRNHLRRRRSKRVKRQFGRMHEVEGKRHKWRIEKLAPYLGK